MKKIATLLFLVTTFITSSSIACTGGTASGTLTPSAAYQTVATNNGRYYTVNVSLCDVYEFTLCTGTGGANCAFDSQLTILDATGATQIVTTDDVCGTNASITWTSTLNGTIRILVSRYNCNHDLASSCTMAYKVTPKVGDYCLNGNASYQTIGGQSCIQLTPEINTQNGCAWNDNPINFNNGFSLSLNYYFGNNINGADGTTFTFQPNPGACGQSGAQLGAGGIPNSLVIEFDTYDNDNPAHVYDIAADHVAVEIDGNLQNGTPYCGPTAARPGNANLDDGVQHLITINWDPATQNLSIYVDGSLRLTCNGNFVTSTFGGQNMVYWGATAATGGLNNQQYFCPSSVVLPVELSDFSSKCVDYEEMISWTAQSENRLDKYLLESTTDGILFTIMETVLALDIENEEHVYTVKNTERNSQQHYYRLSMIDDDGTLKSTELIASHYCGKDATELFNSYSYSNGELNLQFYRESVKYQLLDITGKTITPAIVTNDFEHTQSLAVSNGIYVLKVWNEFTQQSEVQRIYIGE